MAKTSLHKQKHQTIILLYFIFYTHVSACASILHKNKKIRRVPVWSYYQIQLYARLVDDVPVFPCKW